MADEEELELESERDNTGGTNSQIVRKNISLKLKAGSKPRGRPKKGVKAAEKGKKAPIGKKLTGEFEAEAAELGEETMDSMPSPVKMQGSLEPVHKKERLFWNHKVCLIGEKVVDPLIHCCEKCALPILIYGRMIPCKHVFCFDCAKKTEKNCPRCNDPIQRIEQSALGTVFVCTYGGAKHGVSGCRRTYLSQRDLQSHISHRHIKPAEAAAAAVAAASAAGTPQTHTPPKPQIQEYKTRHGPADGHTVPPPPPQQQVPLPMSHDPAMVYHTRPPPVEDVRGMHPHIHPAQHTLPPPPQQQPPPQPSHAHPPHVHQSQTHDNYQIPVMSSSRTNLITVPIQDEFRPEDRSGGYVGPLPQHQQPPLAHQAMPPLQGPPPHQGSMQHQAPAPSTVTYPQSHPPPTHLPPPSQQHFPPTSHPPPLHPGGIPPAGSYANPPPISLPGSMVYSAPAQMSSNSMAYSAPAPMSHPGIQQRPPIPNMSHPPPLSGGAHLPHPMPPISHGPPPSHAPPPVMTSSTNMSHPGGPPPPLRSGPPISHTGPPPQRYTTPHTQYEESRMTPPYVQPGGGHSPRTPWPGPGPQPRGPPPPRQPTNNANMAPPHGQYYQ